MELPPASPILIDYNRIIIPDFFRHRRILLDDLDEVVPESKPVAASRGNRQSLSAPQRRRVGVGLQYLGTRRRRTRQAFERAGARSRSSEDGGG